jgi:hypothetical protein
MEVRRFDDRKVDFHSCLERRKAIIAREFVISKGVVGLVVNTCGS